MTLKELRDNLIKSVESMIKNNFPVKDIVDYYIFDLQKKLEGLVRRE